MPHFLPLPSRNASAWAAAGLLWVPAGLVLVDAARGFLALNAEPGTALLNLAVAAPAGLPLALAARRALRRGSRWGLAAALAILMPLTVYTTWFGGLLGPVAIYAYAAVLSLPLWVLPWARDLVLRAVRGRDGA